MPVLKWTNLSIDYWSHKRC